MTDHITVDPGSGGETIATEQVGGNHYQLIKLVYGGDDVVTWVENSAPLPVKAEGFDAENAAVANNPVLAGGRYDAAPRTLDDGDLGALSVDAAGRLLMGAGTLAIGKLAANSGVDIGDVDVTSLPADTFVAEDGALGKGVLLQGDDGTDRTNVLVDTSGHLQIDVLTIAAGDNNIGNLDVASMPADTFAAEDGSLGKGVLLQGDDGTDRKNVAVDTSGNLQVDVLVLPALASGSNAVGKLAANTGVDIGDVTINNASGGSAVNIQDGGNSISIDDGGNTITVDGAVDVAPTSQAAGDYLPVRISDGSAFSGFASSGWDQDTRAVQRGVAMGVTATTDQTLLAADGSNLFNLMEATVTIFSGTAAPGAKAYVSLYHGTSAAGTEFLRVYAPVIIGEAVNQTFRFSMPDRGATNQAVTAKLSASLGTNGEYSVNVHAYKTSS